jgi:hypothetical protein
MDTTRLFCLPFDIHLVRGYFTPLLSTENFSLRKAFCTSLLNNVTAALLAHRHRLHSFMVSDAKLVTTGPVSMLPDLFQQVYFHF